MIPRYIYLFLLLLMTGSVFSQSDNDGKKERAYLIKSLTHIADPLLKALSEKKLKQTMPIEKVDGMHTTHPSTYLEGFARLLAGMAPWLELGPDETEEGRLRKKYIDLALLCLHNGTDTTSPDYLDFNIEGQSLVDAAFLTHALLRAPTQLWDRLDPVTRRNLVAALKRTRATKPYESNWLLFAGIIEAGLLRFTGECDQARLDYSLLKHKEWYKGDGAYGDGPSFHWDYYNSFVIHPMLLGYT